MSKKLFIMLAILVGSSTLLAACGETVAEPETITIVETVIVEGEVVEVEVQVPVELVTLVARCRAKPPTEDSRCNNLLAGVAAVNADLAAAGGGALHAGQLQRRSGSVAYGRREGGPV